MRSSTSLPSPRRQRLWGLLVLLVVAVAALVTAQLLHPPLVGVASRAPIPGPPAVGDCLLDSTFITMQSLVASGSKPKRPWLRTGPCQGRRFGEVVAVLTDKNLPAPASSTGGDNNDGNAVLDPYRYPCRIAVTVWMGLPGPDTPAVDRWLPEFLTAGMALSGPSPIQRTAGQNWTACIIAASDWQTSVPDAAVNAAAGHPSAGYDSTTRAMANPGPPPPAFAYCIPNVDNPEPVPCTTAHTVELIGAETTDHPTTEADRRGCHTLAQQLTAMPDPTGAGKLTITTIDDQDPGSGRHFLTCLISTTGQHQLTGPLLGLKNGPVPIT